MPSRNRPVRPSARKHTDKYAKYAEAVATQTPYEGTAPDGTEITYTPAHLLDPALGHTDPDEELYETGGLIHD